MKGPVENAAAEEIKEEAFGDILLMISTSCLESTKRFPHFPQIRRRVLTTKKCVTYVSERVLPMSPVHRRRRGGRDLKKMLRSIL